MVESEVPTATCIFTVVGDPERGEREEQHRHDDDAAADAEQARR